MVGGLPRSFVWVTWGEMSGRETLLFCPSWVRTPEPCSGMRAGGVLLEGGAGGREEGLGTTGTREVLCFKVGAVVRRREAMRLGGFLVSGVRSSGGWDVEGGVVGSSWLSVPRRRRIALVSTVGPRQATTPVTRVPSQPSSPAPCAPAPTSTESRSGVPSTALAEWLGSHNCRRHHRPTHTCLPRRVDPPKAVSSLAKPRRPDRGVVV